MSQKREGRLGPLTGRVIHPTWSQILLRAMIIRRLITVVQVWNLENLFFLAQHLHISIPTEIPKFFDAARRDNHWHDNSARSHNYLIMRKPCSAGPAALFCFEAPYCVPMWRRGFGCWFRDMYTHPTFNRVYQRVRELGVRCQSFLTVFRSRWPVFKCRNQPPL